jgi:Flp pilus assembly protein TadD
MVRRAILNKALELDPTNATIYMHRGTAYVQKDDLENALANYNKAIELQTDVPLFYYYRGMVYAELNQKDNAVADFRKVLTLTQDEDMVAQTNEWLKALGVTP